MHDIRDYAKGRHRQLDDRPYGGGPGMVMMAEPVAKALRHVKREGSHVVYLSPQGRPFSAELARGLAQHKHLVLLCGHYEGIDQRVIDKEVDEEVSIGDYVLTNGCLAAIVVLDALVRFVPGVIGRVESAEQDSFEAGILDCPHYTRPDEWEGEVVPPILMSGNHAEIARWRHEAAIEKTKKVRPDLYSLKLKN